MTTPIEDKKPEINQFKNVIVYEGVEYPATYHNVRVWARYKMTNDESELLRLSTVVLDLGDSDD